MPTFYRADVADNLLESAFNIPKVSYLNPNTLPSSLWYDSVTPGFKLGHWHDLTNPIQLITHDHNATQCYIF